MFAELGSPKLPKDVEPPPPLEPTLIGPGEATSPPRLVGAAGTESVDGDLAATVVLSAGAPLVALTCERDAVAPVGVLIFVPFVRSISSTTRSPAARPLREVVITLGPSLEAMTSVDPWDERPLD